MSGKVKDWSSGPDATADALGSVQIETMLPVRTRPSNPAGCPKVESTPHPNRRRIPRITRLMALAVKFQDMIESGRIRDYADIARLGYVTRARVTQIMNLLNLAPDIQERILTQDSNQTDFKLATERHIRQIVSAVDWGEQRRRVSFR